MVLGDVAVDARLGSSFWSELSSRFSSRLKTAALTEAIIDAVECIGAALATNFPADATKTNQLSDWPNEEG